MINLKENKNCKVLVTGAAGYIGSVFVRRLLEEGYKVRGLDSLNFGGESLLNFLGCKHFDFIKGDISKKTDLINSIEDIDVVVHLAAIVGDLACSKQPDIAKETNWEASKNFYDLCHSYPKIKRFIFASTCSNY